MLDGTFISFEFLWPLSVSGGFESSFLFIDGVLVVNPIFLKLLIVHDIVSLSFSVVIDNGLLVFNLKTPFTGLWIFNEVNVFSFVLESLTIFLVDMFLVLNESVSFFMQWCGCSVDINSVPSLGIDEDAFNVLPEVLRGQQILLWGAYVSSYLREAYWFALDRI